MKRTAIKMMPSESLESSSSDENNDDKDDGGLGSTSALEVDTDFTRVSGFGEDQQYRSSAYELQSAECIRWWSEKTLKLD